MAPKPLDYVALEVTTHGYFGQDVFVGQADLISVLQHQIARIEPTYGGKEFDVLAPAQLRLNRTVG